LEDDEEGKEESKESAKPQKKKKKVGFSVETDKKIRVIKLKRGGRKYVSSIVGLDKYGVDLAEAAKKLSKKVGAGAASMLIEYKELSQ
jgi:translation initiation factor 1 (eIF-1/SUI1)